MNTTTFVDSAKVMSKGQVTIPKDIRAVLGVDNGDRVSFIVSNGKVQVVNSAVYAMETLQSEMKGEAQKVGIYSEEDVIKLVDEIRKGEKD